MRNILLEDRFSDSAKCIAYQPRRDGQQHGCEMLCLETQSSLIDEQEDLAQLERLLEALLPEKDLVNFLAPMAKNLETSRGL